MKIKLLFVCLGNICRSPSAEAIMLKLISENKLKDKYLCDSAGTISFHKGKPADSRMRKFAGKRAIDILSISRPFDSNSDFDSFDRILVMDQQNYRDLAKLSKSENQLDKISLITDYCTKYEECKFVPDPYFGGDEGFNLVIDILEDACLGLLSSLQAAQLSVKS